VTSNPTIFQKALEAGSAYDAQTQELADAGADLDEAVRSLTTSDIRDACDGPAVDLRADRRGRRPGQH
jgi:transaldolase